MLRTCLIFILLIFILFAFQSVFADYEQLKDPVLGRWMLDKVYENASTEDRFVLDPESAASVYGEKNDVFSFFADGSADMTADVKTVNEMYYCGLWEKDGTAYRLVLNNTSRFLENGDPHEPDIDPPFVYEYIYDEGQNVLHRYWQDDDPEADYHDLDFVYMKIPQNDWRMTKVYERGIDGKPILLDPESSQSLYAESVNTYTLGTGWVSMIVPAEIYGESYYEYGEMERDGDAWLLKFDDGSVMRLCYDTEKNLLHRYWRESSDDSTYHELDFVYERQPIANWRLKYIYRTGSGLEPMLLDPDAEQQLYHEQLYSYLFGSNGEASASIPQVVNDKGNWKMTDGNVLLSFDDGTEMLFQYDSKADVLHRYKNEDGSVLDFVFLKD